ncbi:hypothetical protein C8F04DRAFT_1189856 [Mycena alexandri]|uniref:Zn(2)-C6 fungal-type domain-containing protein n=1 Tax=Mycena alexandri TaxID=1745969 RepID=A0AAD6SGD6_9AGAR|nr:hypothetical protein C8F04DRAFT_1189856 [Mycena alexandri]
MASGRHGTRMATALSVINCDVPITCTTPPTGVLSVPAVYPTEPILDSFWRRVAQLTTRYHDVEHKWIAGDEIRLWNSYNTDPCQKCLSSKKRKKCIIDDDQPSCRTCRDTKLGCDRKPRFVFDMTKDEFFPSYEQFLQIFQNPEKGRLRRYEKGINLPRLDNFTTSQWKHSDASSFAAPLARATAAQRSRRKNIKGAIP